MNLLARDLKASEKFLFTFLQLHRHFYIKQLVTTYSKKLYREVLDERVEETNPTIFEMPIVEQGPNALAKTFLILIFETGSHAEI